VVESVTRPSGQSVTSAAAEYPPVIARTAAPASAKAFNILMFPHDFANLLAPSCLC
jgi:hypothetical protein